VNRRPVEVFNVTAKIDGILPDLEPLVVMTPRSGWWNCASERGGGIAVWLEMLRELTNMKPERSVFFLASTGHELGHYGLDHYLAERKGLVGRAAAWIHLGANFGAAVGSKPVLQVSDQKLHRLALEAIDAAGMRPLNVRPVGTPPKGEARNIHEAGGRYISLVGSNGLFHHPQDRWPSAVDLDAVMQFTDAFARIAKELVRAQEL
jgi:hypothetical protein